MNRLISSKSWFFFLYFHFDIKNCSRELVILYINNALALCSSQSYSAYLVGKWAFALWIFTRKLESMGSMDRGVTTNYSWLWRKYGLIITKNETLSAIQLLYVIMRHSVFYVLQSY
ncbi:unnamed protein product, partial [Vitis vinifera]|uniref:Uncharacterized protein n=1 Tax=Vitis vinifera TaxID=29760 RepID=D7SUA4_VITVI